MKTEQNMPRESWHLDKRVPISLIATLLIQMGVWLWFVAQLDGRVSTLEKDEAEIEAVARENAREINLMRTVQAVQEQKLQTILETVRRTDQRLERFERGQFQN